MKTKDVLGEDQYKVLFTNLSLYFSLTDEEKVNIENNVSCALQFARNAVTVINANTAEIKKVLNEGKTVKLEELNNLLNSKRELLRIIDCLYDALDQMRTRATDLINQIEELS
jgi:hypothetical protein